MLGPFHLPSNCTVGPRKGDDARGLAGLVAVENDRVTEEHRARPDRDVEGELFQLPCARRSCRQNRARRPPLTKDDVNALAIRARSGRAVAAAEILQNPRPGRHGTYPKAVCRPWHRSTGHGARAVRFARSDEDPPAADDRRGPPVIALRQRCAPRDALSGLRVPLKWKIALFRHAAARGTSELRPVRSVDDGSRDSEERTERAEDHETRSGNGE